MSGHNHEQLMAEILRLSRSTDWSTVRFEWSLHHIWINVRAPGEEPMQCLCGHTPISQICVIYNSETREYAEVGSTCVKKFMGIRPHLLFAAVERIRRDEQGALNDDAIEYFHRKRRMDDFEHRVYRDTMHKRELSKKQMAIRLRVNRRVLDGMVK
jgi:hypothetical protein